MKKKVDNHNTVDVRVGSDLRAWVVHTYGSDLIKLDRDANLWSIIKQNLELRPNDYTGIDNPEEFISFVLLTDGGNTKAYAEPDPARPGKHEYRVNTMFRCFISERGKNIIIRYLRKQFKNSFHNYMRGALNNNPDLSITEAITEFLMDVSYPEMNNRVISTLCKDWYRFRKKYPDDFKIPIFF